MNVSEMTLLQNGNHIRVRTKTTCITTPRLIYEISCIIFYVIINNILMY